MLEPIDPSSPNLDGDFKAILEVMSKREKREFRCPKQLPTLEESANENGDITARDAQTLQSKSLATLEELATFRDNLLNAVDNDDTDALKETCKQLSIKRVHLTDDNLKDPDNKANLLHRALINKKLKVAEYLIANAAERFLMEEYSIEVKEVHSSKTALHILAEQGNTLLCKKLLERIPAGTARNQFLEKTVLTEMKGQRPRHLSSIHIAALYGVTEMIEVLVNMGVDVNSKNNKNDTPILWAARNNHILAVRYLIQLNADLHCENDKGSTPLYWAIRYGYPQLVKILIEEGHADIHQQRKLGLVSPIVLASALGYTEIINTLIKNGADVNIKIPGRRTSLQMAAFHDNDESVKLLLEKGAEIDDSDDSGNTPLMYAVSSQSMSSVGVLIQNNANMDCKNKMGKTIWDFAIDQPDDELMKTLVYFYQMRLGESESRNFKFPPGRTPLHVAAAKGDIGKIKCLLDIGIDPLSVDQNGNSFFHVAARVGGIKVIEEFISTFDVNHKNLDGDTPMNLAVKYGQIETVKLLIQKAKLDLRNNSQQTVLHVAASSGQTDPEMVKILVEVMVKTTSWALVDAKDMKGNTALNIAAKKGFSNLIESLSNLNPMIPNDTGDTPLHTAAYMGHPDTLEELLSIFCQPGKGLHIDKQNNEGETALHICAKQGDADSVRLLIQNGSDLAVRNIEGNTILHEMCEIYAEEPHKKDSLTAVYQTIVLQSPRWWCICKDLHLPDEDSEKFTHYKKDAIVFLTSGNYNLQGMDVIKYAASLGSIDMLNVVLSTPDVYKVATLKGFMYDVTNLEPAVQYRTDGTKNRKSAQNSVGIIQGSDEYLYTQTHDTLLDIVVNLQDEVIATNILDMTPIKQLIRNYWTVYQWIYGLLMIAHIVYMGCFTAYSIPILTDYFQNESDNLVNASPSAWPMVLFLIWPGLILLFELFSIISAAIKSYREKGCCRLDKHDMRSPGRLLIKIFLGFLSQVTAFLFVISVVVWFILYVTAYREQVYLVAVILVIGWMFTIAFTKGFEQVHAFSIMLKYIVIKDITRFLFIYTFVIIGFSFAFNALLQITPGVATSRWETVFLTFNLMLGLQDVINEGYQDDYTAANGSFLFFQIVYLGYISLSTIILLNLLIAMMTDTYTAIKAREGTTWRVGSIQLALGIENSMPFIRTFLMWLGLVDNRLKFNDKTNRWSMIVPWDEADTRQSIELNPLIRSVEKLENRVMQIYSELSKQIESLHTKLERKNVSAFDKVKVLTATAQTFKSFAGSRPKSARRRTSKIAMDKL